LRENRRRFVQSLSGLAGPLRAFVILGPNHPLCFVGGSMRGSYPRKAKM
jgi:hypothetical protein